MAKEGARNEEITKKSLEAKFRCLCVRTKVDVRRHCEDLGGTSKLEPDPMRTHQNTLCEDLNDANLMGYSSSPNTKILRYFAKRPESSTRYFNWLHSVTHFQLNLAWFSQYWSGAICNETPFFPDRSRDYRQDPIENLKLI
ncbi:hypothetical protein PIB30_076866 [Stylosanthes scabra]|uniref:Uncharacterized protein n=1 Tax=Stylosanthes scabra TaxID=79078 RepID=A0ABU6UPT3_9FABA|nr:hypothetical protein [Stylosanthes scabra]